MMKKLRVIIWSPFLLGLLLLLVTKIDLYQFSSQSIEVRSMLSREMPIVIFGLLLSSVYWLLKKQWVIAIQAVVSPALFMACFVLGGTMGGAFLNAT